MPRRASTARRWASSPAGSARLRWLRGTSSTAVEKGPPAPTSSRWAGSLQTGQNKIRQRGGIERRDHGGGLLPISCQILTILNGSVCSISKCESALFCTLSGHLRSAIHIARFACATTAQSTPASCPSGPIHW